MNNVIVRSLTGIVFVAIVVGCILFGYAAFLFLIITGMTVWEFCSLLNKHANCQIKRFITTVSAIYLFLAIMAFVANAVGAEIFIPYIILIIYLLISELYHKDNNVLHNWAYSLMSQLYIALPFSMIHVLSLNSISEYGNVIVKYNPILPLSVFIFLWASDTGAYCFGRMLGKHKLFPRISPNKTWEGSIGGGITAIASSQIVAMTTQGDYSFGMGYINNLAWAGLAVVIVIFGTWGDLVESLFKRKLDIKDSGNILPGHGGMLDRFDSSLIALPVAVCYIFILNSAFFANMFAQISGLF